jgi:hypothetical protein
MFPNAVMSTIHHTDNLPVRFQVFRVMCNRLNRINTCYLFRRKQVVVKSRVVYTNCCNFVVSTQQNDVRSEIFFFLFLLVLGHLSNNWREFVSSGHAA